MEARRIGAPVREAREGVLAAGDREGDAGPVRADLHDQQIVARHHRERGHVAAEDGSEAGQERPSLPGHRRGEARRRGGQGFVQAQAGRRQGAAMPARLLHELVPERGLEHPQPLPGRPVGETEPRGDALDRARLRDGLENRGGFGDRDAVRADDDGAAEAEIDGQE